MKGKPAIPAPEFSRRVELSRVSSRSTAMPIVAEPGEREALARRFGLLALDRLEAEISLARLAGGFIRLTARFTAAVVQACVVSLDPVPGVLTEEFSLLYGRSAPDSAVVVDLESEIVEPFEGDAIDVGEAVAQQLALALDPYPRAPGARLVGDGDAERSGGGSTGKG